MSLSRQVKSKEELDKKRSRMDARHDYIVATLAENLQLAVPDVEEGLLEGDQVGSSRPSRLTGLFFV